MKSRLATEARQALIADLRRMSPEERLAAYVRHCLLMTQVRLAGQADTRATSQRRVPGAH